MGFLTRGASTTRKEVLTPWVGLLLAALYVGAVLGVAAFSLHLSTAEHERLHLRNGVSWTRWLSLQLSHADAHDGSVLEAELRRLSAAPGIAYSALVDPEGHLVAKSDPTLASITPPPQGWTPTEDPDVEMAAATDEAGVRMLRTFITLGDASGKKYEVRVGLAPEFFRTSPAMAAWMSVVVLVVLSLYLLIHRFIRRSLRPLAAIRNRLLEAERPIEDRLEALRLNGSFDQISSSWNHLIGFVGEMQEELRKANLNTNMSAAIDGYRSERLTDILMHIPFGVLVIDPDRTISFANRSAVGLLCEDGEPLNDAPVSKVMDESLQMALLNGDQDLKAGPSSARRWTDYTFTRTHGEVVLRFSSIAPEGGDAETIVFIQDVTQSKEAERARDQFLYHVTHELRTPLTNIRAYAETLSQDVIDDEQTIRECYNVIMGETQRLSRLVEDILNVSQLEVGTARLQAAEFVLDKIMRNVVQDQQGTADAKNIDLVLHLPSKPTTLRGDKDRLTVVFMNLIGNAIKYTPEGGRVDVRCAVENMRVRVSITDTGIGIAPADQERIFEKFYRVDDSDVQTLPGTGLGLAIVQETVRVHGGTVAVESSPGKGSTFTVTLPVVTPDHPAEDSQPVGSKETE